MGLSLEPGTEIFQTIKLFQGCLNTHDSQGLGCSPEIVQTFAPCASLILALSLVITMIMTENYSHSNDEGFLPPPTRHLGKGLTPTHNI